MKVPRSLLLSATAPLVFAACDSFGQAMTAHTDVVAQAAGHELRVDEVAQLLAANPQIPADPQVVQALADVWVDYILLATAVAEDSTLAAVDLDTFTRPAEEQMIVSRLRGQVIQPDTSFTDEELRQRWATEGPGAEIRARHVLLRVPESASPAQRDSVRALAESIREQAAGGADFAALARQYSQDPGSAEQGGDLGFFGRGRMVAPFEQAAFALNPGQVSPVVESPFGFHVIRVEERRQAEMEAQREEFRQFLVQRSEAAAESTYLANLASGANIQIDPDGRSVVQDIAANPQREMRGRAANRRIATYQGGEITSGEFAEFIRTQPPQVLNAFATANDEQLNNIIEQLARRELLLREAERRGIKLSTAEQDTLRTQARNAIRGVVQASGFVGGTAGNAGIEARVRELLQGAINGTRPLVPLGPLAVALRDAYDPEINQAAFPQVIEKMQQARGGAGQPGAPAMPGAQPGTPPAPVPPGGGRQP